MLSFYLSMLPNREQREIMEALYREYSRLMKYTAFQILREDSLAEDAVHDSFLRLVRHLDRLQDIEDPRTRSFLIVTVKNVATNLKRSRLRSDLTHLRVEKEEAVSDKVMDALTVEEILAKIRTLPEEERILLQLKVSTELSDRRLADLVGISPAAFRKRLQRARAALAKALNEP